jgi:hypothetical protein
MHGATHNAPAAKAASKSLESMGDNYHCVESRNACRLNMCDESDTLGQISLREVPLVFHLNFESNIVGKCVTGNSNNDYCYY